MSCQPSPSEENEKKNTKTWINADKSIDTLYSKCTQSDAKFTMPQAKREGNEWSVFDVTSILIEVDVLHITPHSISNSKVVCSAVRHRFGEVALYFVWNRQISPRPPPHTPPHSFYLHWMNMNNRNVHIRWIELTETTFVGFCTWQYDFGRVLYKPDLIKHLLRINQFNYFSIRLHRCFLFQLRCGEQGKNLIRLLRFGALFSNHFTFMSCFKFFAFHAKWTTDWSESGVATMWHSLHSQLSFG